MKKLEKRQVIILVIAALFVLYAVYALLIAGPVSQKKKPENRAAEIKSFVNALGNDLTALKVSSLDTYVAERAEMPWGRSPFWERAAYSAFAGNDQGDSKAVKIIYSGYVESGKKKMAIINGWEYEVGDSLDIEGYFVKQIAPTHVIITTRNADGELYIPIQE